MSLNMLPLCTKVGSGTQTCHKWWWPGKKAYSLASHAAQVGGEHGAKFFKLKYYAVITGYSHAVLRNNREMLCTFCPISPNGSFLKKQKNKKNNYSTISQSGDWHWYNQIQNISITAKIHVTLLYRIGFLALNIVLWNFILSFSVYQ